MLLSHEEHTSGDCEAIVMTYVTQLMCAQYAVTAKVQVQKQPAK